MAAQEARSYLAAALPETHSHEFAPKGDEESDAADEDAAMENWPVNIVGLGLIVAGVLFMYFLNFVGIVIGLSDGDRRDRGALHDVPPQEVSADLARRCASPLPLREHVVVGARLHVTSLAQLL